MTKIVALISPKKGNNLEFKSTNNLTQSLLSIVKVVRRLSGILMYTYHLLSRKTDSSKTSTSQKNLRRRSSSRSIWGIKTIEGFLSAQMNSII